MTFLVVNQTFYRIAL